MVRLVRLTAQDFKHLDVDITFPNGILAISGPNESGKSSIIEALLFAFFGRTPKAPRGEKSHLINYDADSLLVRLAFEIGNKKFRITRRLHRKRPSEASLHEIEPSGQIRRLATTTTKVNTELTDLLGGIELNDMLASNIVLQKDLNRLAKLQKMERRHVINAMMGRECYTRADDKLLQENRLIRKTLDPERKVLEQLESRKQRYQENVKELKSKQQTSKDLDKKLKKKNQAYIQAEKRYAALKAHKIAKDEKDRINQEITLKTQLQKQRTEELVRLEKLKNRQKQLHVQEKGFTHLDQDLANFIEIRNVATHLDQSHRNLTGSKDTIARLHTQIEELDALTEAFKEYEQVQAKRQEIEVKQHRIMSPFWYVPSIGLLAAGLVALFLNPIIGLVLIGTSVPFLIYLGKTVFAYYQIGARISELRIREQELSKEAAKFETRTLLLEQLKDEQQRAKKITTELNDFRNEVHTLFMSLSSNVAKVKDFTHESDISKMLGLIESTERKLQELKIKRQNIKEELTSVEEQLADLPLLENDLNQIDKEITNLNNTLSTLTLPPLPPDVSSFSERLYTKLESQVRKLGEERVSLRTQMQTTRDRIEELTAFLNEDEGILEEYEKKREEVIQMEQNWKTGRLAIDLIREVAERGREQVRPRVVNVMSRLLTSITDGKYHFPKLSEDYSLSVFSPPAGEYIQADLFSGGTEDQFLLALRLGFAISLLPHGRGTVPQFLLLDEPFAGSDLQRRNNIIRLLQDELSQTFQQIIVVSHQRAVLNATEHQFRMANGRIIRAD